MNPNLVWTNADTLLNFDLIEYVKFNGDEAHIIFSSGEKLLLEAEDAKHLKAFMQAKFTSKTERQKVGFKRDFIG